MLAALLAGCESNASIGVIQVAALGASGEPLAGALAAIEEGGLFVPAYVYGAQAGTEPTGEEEIPPTPGYFTTVLPRGPKGIHIFAEGYQVASSEFMLAPKETEVEEVEVRATPMPEGAARPATENAVFSPSSVTPGNTTTLTVDVTAAEEDPISAQVLAIQPGEGLAAAFGPPVPEEEGAEAVPANGTWSATLSAPVERGSYVYYVVAASENRMLAPIITATLIVE
ncbi:uncharacterized protein CMC5_056890 [Chondromyces crocatus]|uniref:Uncharacterized protein n=1 Tax=Chondromyces crocatus TaxID=52 RepID=A0A0K1EKX8_CHOCO|nr:uncharacterized protein CMC5_056890 [Chondromyces crocatus]